MQWEAGVAKLVPKLLTEYNVLVYNLSPLFYRCHYLISHHKTRNHKPLDRLEKVHADSFILPALVTLLKFSTLCQVISVWKRICQRFLGKIFKKWCEYLRHILRHRKYSDTENYGYRGFHCSQLGNYTAKPSPGYFNEGN